MADMLFTANYVPSETCFAYFNCFQIDVRYNGTLTCLRVVNLEYYVD